MGHLLLVEPPILNVLPPTILEHHPGDQGADEDALQDFGTHIATMRPETIVMWV